MYDLYLTKTVFYFILNISYFPNGTVMPKIYQKLHGIGNQFGKHLDTRGKLYSK